MTFNIFYAITLCGRNILKNDTISQRLSNYSEQQNHLAAAAAKSLQSCPTLCDPIDGSPPGSPVPRILQARTLEWVAISFSNAWKWKVKVKSCPTLRDPSGLQPTRFLHPWDFPGKSTGVGCHCLLHCLLYFPNNTVTWKVFSSCLIQ